MPLFTVRRALATGLAGACAAVVLAAPAHAFLPSGSPGSANPWVPDRGGMTGGQPDWHGGGMTGGQPDWDRGGMRGGQPDEMRVEVRP
ncbi:hypothetical protein [Nocardia sp. NPDC127526]|uniref:hypothetical protein n=1 Tax=Nocardia sp. NPDC127526 TaxID=3345393 RepID=UPI00363E9163